MIDYSGRIDRVQQALERHDADALLVTNLVNVQYLTGFTGTNGQLLVSPARAVFLTDPRYEARAGALVNAAEISVYPARLTDNLEGLLSDTSTTKLGVEAMTMTLAEREDLVGRLPSVELTSTTGIVEELRRTKEPEEVELLRAAVELGERAFTWVLDRIVPGATEREIALDLEIKLREWGAESVSFPPIVGSGVQSAHIHHSPNERELQKGDLVLLDFGCRLSGYCSDMTRTVVLGAASDDQRRMYDLVFEAQQAGIDAVAPNVSGVDADRAARDVIEAAGMGERFGHGLGHGVGLDVHEEPRLKRISEDVLKPGDVVTVEPGVYVQGEGGVRIEDIVLVTETGNEVLGSAPKDELIEL